MVDAKVIRRYTPFFHDGSLMAVENLGQDIILSMESAEIDDSELQDDLRLSDIHTMKGRLHIKGVKNIKMNDKWIGTQFFMPHEYGTIFHFVIQDHEIELQIIWENRPSSPAVNDFSTIVFQMNHVYWENNPDLINPFW